MTESISSDLLARYLAGEAEPWERAAVEAWAADDPDHDRELRRLQAVWSARESGRWNVDRAWARVAERLAPVAVKRPIGRPRARVPLALAAVLVLALGATLVWQAVRPSPTGLPGMVVTGAGERRTLELPDGTRIALAPSTELRVAPAYGAAERRVDLVGEAWFEVRHDEARPFRVHASGTVTEELGTEFSVRALAGGAGGGEGAVRVVVVSGSASLRRAGAPASDAVTLQARDVATLAAGAMRPAVQREVAVDRLVAWREGRLDFENVRLDSVATELARWYGLTFRLENAGLATRRLSATLPLDDLDEALQVLALSLSVQALREGDAVVLR